VAGCAEPDTIHVDNTTAFLAAKGVPITVVNPDDREEDLSDDDSHVKKGVTAGQHWVVEKVVDYRLKDGVLEFLLRYKGYGPHQDQWQPEHHMRCHALVEEFFERLGHVQ
jgi:hypothetical protein